MQLASQPVEPKDVNVTILLAGGHQCTLALQSDAPLLHDLLTAVVARSQKQADFSGLFQIPVEEGGSALCFSSEHLVGLVTEPPVFVQQTQAVKPEAADILASNYVQIDNFLTIAEKNQLLDYVLRRESAFVPTRTSTDDPGYRQSMILHAFPEFSELMTNRIQAIIPDVFSKLGLPSFGIAQIEAQLTAHNDGNYYKVHNDNGSSETATRELTYVYYFYREPKPFSGGELRLYDTKVENGFYVGAESFKTVEPRNNSIVFFPSRYLHEVLPVHCPSQAFADSRFTINGWLRR